MTSPTRFVLLALAPLVLLSCNGIKAKPSGFDLNNPVQITRDDLSGEPGTFTGHWVGSCSYTAGGDQPISNCSTDVLVDSTGSALSVQMRAVAGSYPESSVLQHLQVFNNNLTGGMGQSIGQIGKRAFRFDVNLDTMEFRLDSSGEAHAYLVHSDSLSNYTVYSDLKLIQ